MEKKGNIVLDLDQTLIYSKPAEEKFSAADKLKIGKFKFHEMADPDTGGILYVVFERPGLQSFLDYIFQHYNVSVWTAATKDYAAFIISKTILIKPGRKLNWVFFDYHCDLSVHETKHTKSLRMFWDSGKFEIPGHTQKNTIIIDDLPEVYKTQPNNCIPIPAFKFESKQSENDKELNALENKFKETPDLLEITQKKSKEIEPGFVVKNKK